MKQMLTTAGGVFFAIGIISLILGGWSFIEKIKLQNELASRNQFIKTISELTDVEVFNNKELQKKQDAAVTFLVITGISGSIGIGLALAGKSKVTP